jgi:aryl-alcohol dehydrogenase-like predicted oxidoreductase
MRYFNLTLPGGDLKISKLVLGTDYYGTSVPKEMAFKLYDGFVEAGGNCIDTARFYADWMPGGHDASERLLGEWLKSRQAYRKVLISTKGGHPALESMERGRLSRACLESDLNESLRLLGVDHIDLYWLHRDDIGHPVEDIMDSLAALVASGKVRAVGCSNWKVDRIAKANAYALSRGLPGFAMSQIQWSLATSTPEAHADLSKVIMTDEEYQWYLKRNFPVMVYSAQAKGFFSRPLSGPDAINEKARAWFCSPENLRRKHRVVEYAARNGLAPGSVALAYILCNRLPAMALVGCRNMAQLSDTLSAADLIIPETAIDHLRSA